MVFAWKNNKMIIFEGFLHNFSPIFAVNLIVLPLFLTRDKEVYEYFAISNKHIANIFAGYLERPIQAQLFRFQGIGVNSINFISLPDKELVKSDRVWHQFYSVF